MNHITTLRFKKLCSRAGVTNQRSENIFNKLVKLYSVETRKYHNLSHINSMLSWFDKSGSASDSVELAIWFHDIIYEPLNNNNEVESAQYFTDHLGSFIESKQLKDVERLILATDPARPRSGQKDEDLIIDLDLNVLGSAPKVYETYRSAIRNEYSAVLEKDFKAGRSMVLKRFLTQKIYVSSFFTKLENQAISNITHELETINTPTS